MGISVEGQAFILVIAAGLCTTIGASVVFFPTLANLAKPKILSVALGFAAGIMLYISLIDIYGKSVDGFLSQPHDEGDAKIYACLTFFGGCFVMIILDHLVEIVLDFDSKRAAARGDTNVIRATLMGSTAENGNALNNMREDFEGKIADQGPDRIKEEVNSGDEETGNVDFEDAMVAKEKEDKVTVGTTSGKDHEKLTHMGWAMAVAIAIHNFPEGMVTYLAYTQDSYVGAALAIGIAIHNIPEGLCVAMPLYYATGRRTYAFLWGTFSGLTEPFGALIVWAVLKNGLSGNTNGILFGLVGGMMTVISIDDLLPTAHKYAGDNPKLVTYAVLFGMLFIASSLMLFEV